MCLTTLHAVLVAKTRAVLILGHKAMPRVPITVCHLSNTDIRHYLLHAASH